MALFVVYLLYEVRRWQYKAFRFNQLRRAGVIQRQNASFQISHSPLNSTETKQLNGLEGRLRMAVNPLL